MEILWGCYGDQDRARGRKVIPAQGKKVGGRDAFRKGKANAYQSIQRAGADKRGDTLGFIRFENGKDLEWKIDGDEVPEQGESGR